MCISFPATGLHTLAYPLNVGIYREGNKKLPQVQFLCTNVFSFFTIFFSICVSYFYPGLFPCAALDAFADSAKEILLKYIKLFSATITNTKQYHVTYNSSSITLFSMSKENKTQYTEFSKVFPFKIYFKLIYIILYKEQNLSSTV